MNRVKNSGKGKKVLVALMAASQIGCFALPALAVDSTVRIAGRSAFDVLASAGGYSSVARAEIMQKNLDNAIVSAVQSGMSPVAVNVNYVKGMPVLTVGGYYIGTVDNASAKAAGTTPATLAQRWADNIRSIVADTGSIQAYVAQLTGGDRSQPMAQLPPSNSNSVTVPDTTTSTPYRGRVVYMPAGMQFPVVLQTALSSETARPGDMIQARLDQPIAMGDTTIPAGTVFTGRVTDAEPGQRLWNGAAAQLGVQFDTMRMPDGTSTPIVGRIAGGLTANQQQSLLGKLESNRLTRSAVRGAAGAGIGAALGTAIGAIAGGGRGLGRGAWSGAAIGGGLGLVQGLILSKGKNIVIPSGQTLQVQLDAPASVSVSGGTI